MLLPFYFLIELSYTIMAQKIEKTFAIREYIAGEAIENGEFVTLVDDRKVEVATNADLILGVSIGSAAADEKIGIDVPNSESFYVIDVDGTIGDIETGLSYDLASGTEISAAAPGVQIKVDKVLNDSQVIGSINDLNGVQSQIDDLQGQIDAL